MLIIEFSYNFLYVWYCMKLYDKKFLIYGNCMIRSFGQPRNNDGQRDLSSLMLSDQHGLQQARAIDQYISGYPY